MKPEFTFLVFFLLILNLSQVNACNSVFHQDDPLNGPKKEYYPNGKLMKEYTLRDGKAEGSYRTYNTLGNVVSDQYFKNGLPDGYLRTFYPGGQLKSEGVVRPDGDITGPSKEYFENGRIKRESMISGEFPNISSQTKIYSEYGRLITEMTAFNGQFVYSVSYDNQGRVTTEQKPGQIISYWYEKDTGKKHTSINGVEQK
jgi:hypothetical protein